MSTNDKTKTDVRDDTTGTADQTPHDLSRRGFFKGMGAAALAAAATPFPNAAQAQAQAQATPAPDGTPEQIHLTWGDDPTSNVVVSWASMAQAVNPRVLFHSENSRHDEVVHAVQRVYTDGSTATNTNRNLRTV